MESSSSSVVRLNMLVSPEIERKYDVPCEETRISQALLYRRLAERSLTIDLLEKHKQLLDMDIKFVVCADCKDDIKFEKASYSVTSEPDSDNSDDDNSTEAQQQNKRKRILQLNSHVQCIRQGRCSCSSDITTEMECSVMGKRLIHIAVSDPSLLPVVMYLHGNGCDMNSLTFDRDCCSPIFFGVLNNQAEIVNYLVQQGVNVNSKNVESPLSCAIRNDFDDIVRILLSAKDINVNECYLFRQPVLLHCVRLNPEYCEMLLEAGADPNLPGVRGNTALIHAVNSSDVDLVKMLIRYGADVNKANQRNEVALLILIYREEIDMTRILLEAGGNPNYVTQEDGNSLIILSSYSGNIDLINLIIKFGGDVAHLNSHGYSALHIAAWNGHLDCVKSLLDSGAPHDKRTGDQNTPLSLAAHGGYTEVIEILLPLGCNVNNSDKDMDTPLLYAAYNGMSEAVQSLIRHGADPNHCNRVKTTSLWNAVYMQHKDVVKQLLLKNVKLDVSSVGINQHSQSDAVVLVYDTPMSLLHVAVDRGCAEIALLLVTAGYNIYRETWLLDMNVSEHPDKPLINLLSKYIHNPPRLLAICRNYFRSVFSLDLTRAVENLDIPGSLKNYLTLQDLKNTSS